MGLAAVQIYSNGHTAGDISEWKNVKLLWCIVRDPERVNALQDTTQRARKLLESAEQEQLVFQKNWSDRIVAQKVRSLLMQYLSECEFDPHTSPLETAVMWRKGSEIASKLKMASPSAIKVAITPQTRPHLTTGTVEVMLVPDKDTRGIKPIEVECPEQSSLAYLFHLATKTPLSSSGAKYVKAYTLTTSKSSPIYTLGGLKWSPLDSTKLVAPQTPKVWIVNRRHEHILAVVGVRMATLSNPVLCTMMNAWKRMVAKRRQDYGMILEPSTDLDHEVKRLTNARKIRYMVEGQKHKTLGSWTGGGQPLLRAAAYSCDTYVLL